MIYQNETCRFVLVILIANERSTSLELNYTYMLGENHPGRPFANTCLEVSKYLKHISWWLTYIVIGKVQRTFSSCGFLLSISGDEKSSVPKISPPSKHEEE